MGYTTTFNGCFKISPALTFQDYNYLKNFTSSDHREKGFPGIWCDWVPSEDGLALEWNGGEKFYHYVEWLRYLIEKFFEPNGYKLQGEVEWFGEEHTDRGLIRVKNNKVQVLEPVTTWQVKKGA